MIVSENKCKRKVLIMAKVKITKRQRKMIFEEENLKNLWKEYITCFYKSKTKKLIEYEAIKNILDNNLNDYCFMTKDDLSECIKCKGFKANGGYVGHGKRKECFRSSKQRIKAYDNEARDVIGERPMLFEQYVKYLEEKFI